MTALSVIGGHIVAFSFLMPLYLVSVNNSSKNIIYFLFGALVYTIAQIITSAVWFILIPLRDFHALFLPVSVFSQEVSRICAFAAVLYVAHLISHRVTNSNCVNSVVEKDYMQKVAKPKIDLRSGVSIGCGFGFMSVLVMFIPILWQDSGEGTYFLPYCSQVPFFALGAFSALFSSIVHVCATIITFQTLVHAPLSKAQLQGVFIIGDRKLSVFCLLYVLVPILHTLLAASTLINEIEVSNFCLISILCQLIVTLLTIVATAFFVLLDISRNARKRRDKPSSGLEKTTEEGKEFSEIESLEKEDMVDDDESGEEYGENSSNG